MPFTRMLLHPKIIINVFETVSKLISAKSESWYNSSISNSF